MTVHPKKEGSSWVLVNEDGTRYKHQGPQSFDSESAANKWLSNNDPTTTPSKKGGHHNYVATQDKISGKWYVTCGAMRVTTVPVDFTSQAAADAWIKANPPFVPKTFEELQAQAEDEVKAEVENEYRLRVARKLTDLRVAQDLEIAKQPIHTALVPPVVSTTDLKAALARKQESHLDDMTREELAAELIRRGEKV